MKTVYIVGKDRNNGHYCTKCLNATTDIFKKNLLIY